MLFIDEHRKEITLDKFSLLKTTIWTENYTDSMIPAFTNISAYKMHPLVNMHLLEQMKLDMQCTIVYNIK
jgi:hypothetical protein